MQPVVILSKLEQEYLLRIVEAALQLDDLRQLFLWSQGQLQALLPHRLMVCLQFDADGAVQRLETLHGSVLAADALARLCDPAHGLALRLARHALAQDALPAMMTGAEGEGAGVLAPFAGELAACGFDNLLLHGSGPLAGGATMFLLCGMPMKPGPRHSYFLSLLLPHLHLALARLAAAPQTRGRPVRQAALRGLSEREAQIAHWLREGKTNAEIAAIVGLSALTVRNHLQRMYRLLQVRNRTEAVARCASLRLLPEGGRGVARSAPGAHITLHNQGRASVRSLPNKS